MSTKIITVAATPPAESSGSDYNKGAPLNATEFDQNLINLRAAVDRCVTTNTGAFNIGSGQIVKDSSGNVGIGTTSPSGPLHVNGLPSYFTRLGKDVILNPNYSGLNTHAQIGVSSGMGLRLATNGDNDRLIIDSSGNVLIGSPTAVTGAKLEVTGEISINKLLTDTTTKTSILYSGESGNTGAVALWGSASNASSITVFGQNHASYPGIIMCKINTIEVFRATYSGLAVTGDISVSTKTPANASAAGTTGTITWDSSYVYVCTATNTWKRAAIATW